MQVLVSVRSICVLRLSVLIVFTSFNSSHKRYSTALNRKVYYCEKIYFYYKYTYTSNCHGYLKFFIFLLMVNRFQTFILLKDV